MVLRRSGSDLPLVSLAILLATIVVAARRIADSVVPAIFVIGIVASVVGVVYTRTQSKARRVGRLRAKYGDDSIVERILQRQYWEGQTGEQLRDSLGDPEAVEEQMLITRSRQVWRYGSPSVQITLDNDVVVTWGKSQG